MRTNLKLSGLSMKGLISTQRRFVFVLCSLFLLVVLLIPFISPVAGMEILGLPLSFLFKIIIGPLFILLILKYALSICERIDLKDPELENE